MTRHAILKYSGPLVVQAVRAYWLRGTGVGMLFSIVAIVSLLLWNLWRGDRSWSTGFFAAATLLVVVLPITVYIVHYRNSLAKFRALKSPVSEFSADDATFTMSSDQGAVTLQWTAIKEIWRYQSFWLLLFSKSQFVTFPLDGVPEDLKAFVLERAKTAGAKIVA